MTTQEFLEMVAREAAEAAVTVEEVNPPSLRCSVAVGGVMIGIVHHQKKAAESVANNVRECLYPLILAACEKALRGCPPPGGLSEEVLAEIDLLRQNGSAFLDGEALVGMTTLQALYAALDALLEELTISRRIIGDESSIPAALLKAAERVGWKKGAEAQRRKDDQATYNAARSVTANSELSPVEAAAYVARVIGDTPLAKPPEEGEKETP